MENQEILNEISYWDSKMNTIPQGITFDNSIDESNYLQSVRNEIIDIAFFKIYIKFEKLFTIMFEQYCIGGENQNGYCPNRKLIFTNTEHFLAIIQKKNNEFTLGLDFIRRMSGHIFEDSHNSFSVLSHYNFVTDLNEMKAIRDYIAHESQSALTNYVKYFPILPNSDVPSANEMLMGTCKRGSKTFTRYNRYVETITFLSGYILSQPYPI